MRRRGEGRSTGWILALGVNAAVVSAVPLAAQDGLTVGFGVAGEIGVGRASLSGDPAAFSLGLHVDRFNGPLLGLMDTGRMDFLMGGGFLIASANAAHFLTAERMLRPYLTAGVGSHLTDHGQLSGTLGAGVRLGSVRIPLYSELRANFGDRGVWGASRFTVSLGSHF